MRAVLAAGSVLLLMVAAAASAPIAHARSFQQELGFQTTPDPTINGAYVMSGCPQQEYLGPKGPLYYPTCLRPGPVMSQAAVALFFLSPPLSESAALNSVMVRVFYDTPPNPGASILNATFFAYDPSMKVVLSKTEVMRSSDMITGRLYGTNVSTANAQIRFVAPDQFTTSGVMVQRGDRLGISISLSDGNKSLTMWWGSTTYPSDIVYSGTWFPPVDSWTMFGFLILAFLLVVIVLPVVLTLSVVSRRRGVQTGSLLVGELAR